MNNFLTPGTNYSFSNNSMLLEAKHLHYNIGDRNLINNISLHLNSGEIVAIIGTNGAGKSTLMRLLSGYLVSNGGSCRLLDKPLHEWHPQQLAKTRAVMRQSSSLEFPFTVEEVVAMGRIPHGNQQIKPWITQQMIVQQVMEQTGCSALTQRDYRQLSGGEQQRVQLARALAQLWYPQPIPCCLFLDEPTSALDLYHQQHTLRLLRQLTRQQPFAVCCILHDLNLAALYADRILLLHQGKLVASGTPHKVLRSDILTRWYQADLAVCHHPDSQLPQVFLRQ